jgi:hypothetical protein
MGDDLELGTARPDHLPERTPPADPPTPPAPERERTQVTTWRRVGLVHTFWSGSFVSGCAVGGLVLLVVLCLVGAVLVFAVGGTAVGIKDDPIWRILPPIAEWAGVLVATLAAHLAAGWWAWRRWPGRLGLLLHVPPLGGYVGAVAWWLTTGWPARYIAWGVAVGLALAVLLVAWLRGVTTARRTLAYLAAILAVLAINGGAVVALGWRASNGYGLQGERSPWAALEVLTAAACLGDQSYIRDHKVAHASCPKGPDADFYAGNYDERLFEHAISSGQPRAAFIRWWEWNRQYQLSFNLELTTIDATVDGYSVGHPFPDSIAGKAAKLHVKLVVKAAFHPGDNDPWVMRVKPGGGTEDWTVSLEWVSLGGWKIRQIEIENPIDPQFIPG